MWKILQQMQTFHDLIVSFDTICFIIEKYGKQGLSKSLAEPQRFSNVTKSSSSITPFSSRSATTGLVPNINTYKLLIPAVSKFDGHMPFPSLYAPIIKGMCRSG
ncbi:hypothetical protein G4B88_031047 [Cannabis sativa]|uniref:Uncharacterized protein n=1 Tax=Cannabis sativa TaxID=3483 RepID=A0A7J6FVT1_CANSA|nr:hypothetical protein G4B88_031047 [Cannabis sativa]